MFPGEETPIYHCVTSVRFSRLSLIAPNRTA